MSRGIAARPSFLFRTLMVASVLASGSASGCVSPASVYTEERRNVPEVATLSVDNRHLGDITVYATVGSARYRLGTVEAFSRRTFSIPRVISLPSEIGLYVVPMVGGAEYISPALVVRPSDSVVLLVENETQYSTVARY